jgi:putative oxidoreductase
MRAAGSLDRHSSEEEEEAMENFYETWSPRILSVLRIVAGLLFLQHGTAKFLGVPHVPDFAQTELFSLLGLTGVIELVGGVLLVVGLFTRWTAFVLSGFMAVAYFMAHAPASFYPLVNQGELAVLYCFVFLYLWVAGPGAWALDAAREPAARRVTA